MPGGLGEQWFEALRLCDGDGLDQTYAITAWNLDSTPFVVLTDGTVLWLDLRVTQVDGDAFIDEDEAGTGYILYMMDVCP